MALPAVKELVPAIVEIVSRNGGRSHFKEIEKGVSELLNISPEDLQKIRSGKRTEFAYRLSWARTAASASGLIKKEERGYWSLVK